MASAMRWIGLLLMTTAVVTGCAAAHGPSETPGQSSLPTDSRLPAASAYCGGGDLSVDRGPYVIAGMQVPGYGIPDMGGQKVDVALRTVVVTGTVTARDAAFFAGVRDIYTPFSVEVDQVIHGDARVGPMRVAVEGGTVGCYTLRVYYGAPLIEPGKRYIFFLGEPVGTESARAYWDAWLVDPDNVVQTVQGPMPLTQLIDRIDRLAAAGSSATP
ncbi:MAG: hypothetical protein ABSC46_02075 [Candidatus Limnocylindrales bacterium]|jgi:hypothetical protein